MSPDGRLPHAVGMQRRGAPFVEVSSGFGLENPGDVEDFSGDVEIGEGDIGSPDELGDASGPSLEEPSLEEEGPMMGMDMPAGMPKPRGAPMMGLDMPTAMPRPKDRASVSVEYWSVSDPHGTRAQMVTDGVGHDDAKPTHGASSHHHEEQSSPHNDSHDHHHEGSHHQDGDRRHDTREGDGHHDDSHHRDEGSHSNRDAHTAAHHQDEEKHHSAGQHDQDHRDEQNQRDQDKREDRDGHDQSNRRDQDRDDERDDDTDDRNPPRPVIIISDPKDKGYQPVAVVGGLIAIFAQAYLWGNVFVTLFKPTRRAAESAMPSEGGAGPQNAPGPEDLQRNTAAAGRRMDGTRDPATAADPEQLPSTTRRFSGASGQPGARAASAVVRS